MIHYRDLSVPWYERMVALRCFNKILKSGYIIDEPSIQLLENKISHYCNRKYGVAVNSGTSAIFLAMMALDIKKEEEVIVPCVGVVPVVNPLLLLGIKPVFVDVGEDYNINPNNIQEKITKNTRAIMAVNWAGKICDMDKLLSISKENNILLIEDASQSFGAKYKSKMAGSFGDISIMSMNAMKVFGTYGEAGMVFTNDSDVLDTLWKIRYNGLIDKVISNYVSLNFRLNTLQASILLQRFVSIENIIKRRRNLASYYHKFLPSKCIIPTEKEYEFDTYFTYNIRVDDRNRLFKYLSDIEIEIQKRDAVLLPHQLPNRKEYQHLKFPVGDSIAKTSISLPFHRKLTEWDVFNICTKIKEYYNEL